MLPINHSLNNGRYQIIKSVGQNGSGFLYEGFDNALRSNVIIKEFIIKLGKVSTLSQQEAMKLAFADEAKNLKQINHAAFLQIQDYFSEIDRHYLVIESINQSGLSELLEKKGRAFSYSEIINWTEQLLHALSHIHSQTPRMIHRDINPYILKVGADGKIKLPPPEVSKKLLENSNKTSEQTPFVATKLHFLPLEQIWEGLDTASQKVILNSYNEKSEENLKQPTDAASDIYALGATMYYLLTAQLPVDALERSIDILEGKPDPLQSPINLNPSVPIELSDVLMKALELKRENRFGMTAMMHQVLRTISVKIKEREAENLLAEEAREEAEALEELHLAEQNRLVLERELVEQQALEIEAAEKRLEEERLAIGKKKLEIEAERNRQKDLAAQKAVKPEPVPAAIEIPVIEVKDAFPEDEPQKSVEQAIAPQVEQTRESASQSFYAATHNVKADDISAVPSNYTQDSGELFADTQKSGSGFWKIPVIALALIALSGAGFGIWYSKQSQTQAVTVETSTQELPTQSTATNETQVTAPTAEPSPATTTAQTIEPKIETPANTNQPTVAAAPIKIKPVATPTPAKPKKQSTPPPQTAENQKKPVTVDDIINDN